MAERRGKMLEEIRILGWNVRLDGDKSLDALYETTRECSREAWKTMYRDIRRTIRGQTAGEIEIQAQDWVRPSKVRMLRFQYERIQTLKAAVLEEQEEFWLSVAEIRANGREWKGQ